MEYVEALRKAVEALSKPNYLALDGDSCAIYDSYEEAIREHARALAITYENVRRNRGV